MLHEPPAQGLDRRPTTVTDEHERDHAFAEALARSRLDARPDASSQIGRAHV